MVSTDPVGPPLTTCAQVEIDGCAFVFVPPTGQLLELNQTATLVWRHCDGSLTRDELIAQLALEHGGESSQVTDVVDATLQLLTRAGLLIPAAPRD